MTSHFHESDWRSHGSGPGIKVRWCLARYQMSAPACCCRYLVQEARRLGLEVIDRCNLTVLLEPGQEDLVSFLAQHQVSAVATGSSCPLLVHACSWEVCRSCKRGLPPARLSPWLQDSRQGGLQPAWRWLLLD